MKQRPDFEKELLVQMTSCAVLPLFFFALFCSLLIALLMFGQGRMMGALLSLRQCAAVGAGFSGGAFLLTVLWMIKRAKKAAARRTEEFALVLDRMERAESGDREALGSIPEDNGFRILAEIYGQTIGSLMEQMEKNRKMAELVAASQRKQLESQFNPHFLYNTLENIRYMCKMEPSAAERMVFSLSNLLRYSLDTGRAQVPLREDLDHLKNYLSILELRFGSRFSCRIQIEPDALDCVIPRLVLQPMIENAVKYGFGRMPELEVELKAYVHEEKLMMICRDNGVGMSLTKLSELQNILNREQEPGRHSGLYNINRRIGLLYGVPYGVQIRSVEGRGTTLVVILPAKEEKDAQGTDRGG